MKSRIFATVISDFHALPTYYRNEVNLGKSNPKQNLPGL